MPLTATREVDVTKETHKKDEADLVDFGPIIGRLNIFSCYPTDQALKRDALKALQLIMDGLESQMHGPAAVREQQRVDEEDQFARRVAAAIQKIPPASDR